VSGDGGRLFQTSAGHRLRTRVRLVTAAQVDAERRDRRCGADAQKATRSATYDGHHRVMTWCMKTTSLN